MSLAQRLARMADVFGSVNIPLANRNFIVDPGFEQWSAQSQSFSGNAYGYKNIIMFPMMAGINGAAQATYVDLTATPLPSGGTPNRWGVNYLQTTAHTGSGAATNAACIAQPIEDARTLSGKSATFSAWFYGVTGSTFTIPSVLLRQNPGTGGSPGAQVVLDKAINWIVRANQWTRLSVRLDIPSVAGMTFGTTFNSNLQLGLWLPANQTFQFFTTQWQLEQSSPYSSSDINGNGGAPTAFEFRGYQAEIARVARFYQSYALNNFYGYVPLAGDPNSRWAMPLVGAMRGIPATSFVDAGSAGSAGSVAASMNLWQYTVANGGQAKYINSFVLDARL